jgi:hypothetical protein
MQFTVLHHRYLSVLYSRVCVGDTPWVWRVNLSLLIVDAGLSAGFADIKVTVLAKMRSVFAPQGKDKGSKGFRNDTVLIPCDFVDK